MARLNKYAPGHPVPDITLAHDLRLDLLDVGQGLVHDGRSALLVWLQRDYRPGRDVRGHLVGAHNVENGASKRRLLSGKIERAPAAFGTVDPHNDPKLSVTLSVISAHWCGHAYMLPGQDGVGLGT